MDLTKRQRQLDVNVFLFSYLPLCISLHKDKKYFAKEWDPKKKSYLLILFEFAAFCTQRNVISAWQSM